MQHEQFTNPHYKKILEKVIKHRHPELSFEEGLKIECERNGCYIIGKNIEFHKTHFGFIFDSSKADHRNTHYWIITDKKECEKIHQINQILGRPITMCELCDVLELDFVPKVCEKNEKPCLTKFTDDVKIEIYLPAKTYYLHEQPIEIQEKIANSF